MVQIKSILRLLLILIYISVLSYPVQGQNDINTETDSLIQLGVEFSIQHHYGKAESIFQRLIEDYPDHPAGYFFMAAMIQSKMMDFETNQWDQDFHKYIRLAIYFANENQNYQNENDLWLTFYHGSALCYLAFYEGRKKDYIAAIRHGLSGISMLKKIIEIQPDFYDVYFGIGSYKYWRSQITRHLNWLPLLSDERQKGINMVKQAVNKGKYTCYAAMNELIWILLDADQYEDAYPWALKGLEKFPQSRFFLWGAAKSAFALERYSDAMTYYQQLLISIINAPFNNYYNEFICRLNLALCFEKLGRYPQVATQLDILEFMPLSLEIEQRLKKQRKQLTQLKKKLLYLANVGNFRDSSITKHDFADEQRSQ